jgi:hypothetical protein
VFVASPFRSLGRVPSLGRGGVHALGGYRRAQLGIQVAVCSSSVLLCAVFSSSWIDWIACCGALMRKEGAEK